MSIFMQGPNIVGKQMDPYRFLTFASEIWNKMNHLVSYYALKSYIIVKHLHYLIYNKSTQYGNVEELLFDQK